MAGCAKARAVEFFSSKLGPEPFKPSSRGMRKNSQLAIANFFLSQLRFAVERNSNSNQTELLIHVPLPSQG